MIWDRRSPRRGATHPRAAHAAALTETPASGNYNVQDIAQEHPEAEEEGATQDPARPVTRIQGNTVGVRRRLKKQAGKVRAAKKA